MTSPSSSPAPSLESMKRRPKSWARKCERCCCSIIIYFPLAFVYGVTTWAIWIEASIGFLPKSNGGTGFFSSALGIILYTLLNWSYTTAVFTDPGSPSNSALSKTGYSQLPTHEPLSREHDLPSLTVKSTGGTRFCKKCQARKPDRAHHCSTCRRCVLKMDHHCPWLATCVGLRNYKPFLLFLIYTTLFCWLCFGITGTWLWKEVLSDAQYEETLMPVNYVLLCTIAGIIGLVLAGFTIWHLSLAWRNQTTIECLEKTRYLSPLRKSLRQHQHQQQLHGGPQSYAHHLVSIHANAIPGATRDEEGEEMLPPPAPPSVNYSHHSPHTYQYPHNNHHATYPSLELSREHARYEAYLDETASSTLPNAFDLGPRRNLKSLFGPTPWLRGLPICNTEGDGWRWEISGKWVEAREEVRRRRELEAGYHHDEWRRRGRHEDNGPARGGNEDGGRWSANANANAIPLWRQQQQQQPGETGDRERKRERGRDLETASRSRSRSHSHSDSDSSKVSLKTLRPPRESFEHRSRVRSGGSSSSSSSSSFTDDVDVDIDFHGTAEEEGDGVSRRHTNSYSYPPPAANEDANEWKEWR